MSAGELLTSTLTTGDTQLDKLISDHGNATYDCGDFREPGEDPCYDDDRKYQKYEEAAAKAAETRRALFDYLRERLQSRTT